MKSVEQREGHFARINNVLCGQRIVWNRVRKDISVLEKWRVSVFGPSRKRGRAALISLKWDAVIRNIV